MTTLKASTKLYTLRQDWIDFNVLNKEGEKMNKAMVTLTLILASSFVGCGDKDDTSAESAASDTSGATDTAGLL
jgi:hypothetical protein